MKAAELLEKAVELLEKIEKEHEVLSQKIDIIDRNVKHLMNIKQQPQVQAVTSENKDEEDLYKFTGRKEVFRKKTIKTYGFIKRTGGMPIDGVNVTVFNDKNEEVSHRVTNNNGYWESRLPAGNYCVEYKKDGLVPVNKTFSIKNHMEDVEVI